jgi:hypothetical protein
MNIQINTDHNVDGSEKFSSYVTGVVQGTFARFSGQLSHVELHFSDQNSSKTGTMDKRCVIEVRITGRKSTAVTCDASTIDEALIGATEKMKNSIEHTLGRTSSKHSTVEILETHY